MLWSTRIRLAACRIAIVLAATVCLAAQTITAKAPVTLYDRPLEKHYMYYSRGKAIDTIVAGEQITVRQKATVQTPFGPQTWYRVERQAGAQRKGWVESTGVVPDSGK